MSTRVLGHSWAMRSVASMPFIPGMRTSMRMTSGCRALAWARAEAPSEASPMTSMLSSASSTMRNPMRMSA